MNISRWIELSKLTMGELLEPWVTMDEFDFMLENIGKTIDEIEFDP